VTRSFARTGNGAATAIALFLGMWLPAPAQETRKAPFEKQQLMTALQIGVLRPDELVKYINERGLAFPMTVADERDFRNAGATDAIVDAMWAKEHFEIKPGPPLTLEVIIGALQTGASPKRLKRMVEVLHADVKLDPAVAAKIKTAGGNNELVGAIFDNIYTPPPPPPVQPTAPTQPVPAGANPAKPVEPPKPVAQKQYDELIQQAQDTLKTGNRARAKGILDEAKKLDPQRPQAYAVSGLVWIGSFGMTQALVDYSAALDRNGEIQIPMEHEHGRSLKLKEKTCEGMMTISHTAIKFNGNVHKFTIEAGQIKDVGFNASKASFGMFGGGFHIIWNDSQFHQEHESFRVVVEKDEKEAGRMVVDMIRKYVGH
jgi:hypothetical protein